jgi:farnesyl-diphosphate farnesyltransferase
LREPIGLAYLLARAADTIADTALVAPPERIAHLLAFRAQVNGARDPAALAAIAASLSAGQSDPHERTLLLSLEPALALLEQLTPADRAAVQRVVTTLTEGMEFDLKTFPPEQAAAHGGALQALNTAAELDTYTYYVAGCVGAFWTELTVAHTPALRGWNVAEQSAAGIRFGKALQYTNILRDVPKDLRIGRCYLPQELLTPAGLSATDLLGPANAARATPVLHGLLRVALEHYRAARDYTLAIPPHCVRLRLACLWPVLIGLKTFAHLVRNPRWLEPGQASKIRRGQVHRILLLSLPSVISDTLLRRWMDSLLRDVEQELQSPSP